MLIIVIVSIIIGGYAGYSIVEWLDENIKK